MKKAELSIYRFIGSIYTTLNCKIKPWNKYGKENWLDKQRIEIADYFGHLENKNFGKRLDLIDEIYGEQSMDGAW